jgi:predicted RNA-binding Zn-ribbon protein involved in translation (DUF1610 family)
MIITCEVCGKQQERRGARAKLVRKCIDCHNRLKRESKVKMTCPRCGKAKDVIPYFAVRRKSAYCKRCPRLVDPAIPDTYDAGYVVGVMLGDGSFARSRHSVENKDGSRRTGYSLRLGVTSEAFARKFADHVGRLMGRAPWVWPYTRERKANPAIGMPPCATTEWIVVANSREWYERLRPVKHDHAYDRIVGLGPEFKAGFVAGMIDSEGYVNEKYTDVANKDRALLDLTVRMLGDLGHKAKVYGPYPYSRGVMHLRVNRPLEKTA